MENTTMIYHIVEKESWDKQKELDLYSHPSLAAEGFIHCSTASQVAGVLERYYADVKNLLKLTIDPKKLTHELKYEFASIGEEFPHIFGSINKEAIVFVEEVKSLFQ
jgi:uncharacterized protein (DUF952 family)